MGRSRRSWPVEALGVPAARVGFALVLLALVGACARKAPGPEECQKFALQASGLRSTRDLQQLPRLRQAVDELTRACLVTPYDRELLRCVEESGRARACLTRFEQRRALR